MDSRSLDQIPQSSEPTPRTSFEMWLEKKEKERERAKLAAKEREKAAKREEEAKERRKNAVLQEWSEHCEAKIREKRALELHRRHIEEISREAEHQKELEHEELCKQLYKKWVQDKEKLRKMTGEAGLRGGRKGKGEGRGRQGKRLSLQTFQVMVLPQGRGETGKGGRWR